jgi:hypothetical protein
VSECESERKYECECECQSQCKIERFLKIRHITQLNLEKRFQFRESCRHYQESRRRVRKSHMRRLKR